MGQWLLLNVSAMYIWPCCWTLICNLLSKKMVMFLSKKLSHCINKTECNHLKTNCAYAGKKERKKWDIVFQAFYHFNCMFVQQVLIYLQFFSWIHFTSKIQQSLLKYKSFGNIIKVTILVQNTENKTCAWIYVWVRVDPSSQFECHHSLFWYSIQVSDVKL